MKAEQTWRAVLGELEMQMSQASFSTWLRDSKLIAFEDNIFVVGVESGFITVSNTNLTLPTKA